jgi:ATP-binding cassette subfamily C protein LapB
MTHQKTASAPGHQKSAATVNDPLLDCLVFLTGHFGRAKSADAIKAGLAYDSKGMGPELFCEAAGRLALKTRIVRRKNLEKIPSPVLPAVLVLENDQACVLMRREPEKNHAWIFAPENGEVRKTSLKELEKSFTGYAIFIHPRSDFSQEEESGTENNEGHWFWSVFAENRRTYGQVILAAILINLFALTSPIFIMTVYDRVIPNNAIETGWVLAIGALTVYVFDFIIRNLRGYYIDIAGRKIDIIAARRIFDQVMDMKLAHRPSSSGVFANMLRDFDSVRDFMTSASLTAVVDLPFSALFLTVIYFLGGPVAFMLAGLIIIVIIAGILLQVPLRRLVRKSIRSAESKHGLLVESIHGLETIKAVSADGRLRAKYGDLVGENAYWSQKSRFISALGVNIATLLQQSATILVVLIGMYLVRDSNLSMGALIACVILGGRAIAPIGQVANLMSRYHQARNAYKTLNTIMEKPVERPAQKQFLHRPQLSGKISFDKVGFAYPGHQNKVLDNVTFTVNPGEKVGLIGRIGSGKSTISRLMLGLYDPLEGTILVDDTDYRQIDPADLRRNVGYIAQDVVLFTGTVRDNITMSCPQATEEEIFRAASEAGVHEFIKRHPMGYDAPVGERGEGLSGGQRQAIALARAMLNRPEVLVCDEPTNSMDVQAEENFRRHIEQQAGSKTLILITHRHQLLSLVDRLILADQGKVIMDGPRDKVLEALSTGKISVPGPEGNAGKKPEEKQGK